ncbi:MAG: DUF494 family protein [Deferrisomatales bacterium]
MKGRMFDVVAYITRHYGPAKAAAEDLGELRDELLDAGFEEDDVERALLWLGRLGKAGGPLRAWMTPPPGSLRVATEDERRKLTADARGFVLRLERAGILDPATREALYERALNLDVPELGLEEVRVLLALLFRSRPSPDDGVADRILEGDLEALYH